MISKVSGKNDISLSYSTRHYVVSVVSWFMHSPKKDHMNAVLRILQYLKGSPGKGLQFKRNQGQGISGYIDADWSEDRTDRKFTLGYFRFIEGNLVTWRSKKQKMVAWSSVEAEYRGMVHGVCELLSIKRILRGTEIIQSEPMVLYSDICIKNSK